MKKAYLIAFLWLAACARVARFQPASVGTDYTPQGMQRSVTLKDTSVHYDPAVLAAGTSRSGVQDAFGDPNASGTNERGQLEDVYAFNPDGTKFVDPQVRPRNVAMAVFSMGTSVAVRQARLALAEKKLTLYHVVYGLDSTIESVREEKMSGAPQGAPGSAP